MSILTWDQSGERSFEYGLDRGVLYLSDNSGVPWNGLVKVTEVPNAGINQPLFFDGLKYGEIVSVSDFAGTIKAKTYPDEFLPYSGVLEPEPGFMVTNQTPKRFGLSYRTKAGNDLSPEAGYKIHVVRNVLAIPLTTSHETVNASPDMMDFDWNISTVPSRVPGYRPTSQLIFDSRRLNEEIMSAVEDILYGTEEDDARLPPFEELMALISLV